MTNKGKIRDVDTNKRCGEKTILFIAVATLDYRETYDDECGENVHPES